MKPSLQLKLSQHLTLTPQLQQSIRLLQLSTLELNQELERFLQENPLLERDEEEGEEAAAPGTPPTADAPPVAEPQEFEASSSTTTEAPADDYEPPSDMPEVPDVGEEPAREALDEPDWVDEGSYAGSGGNADGEDSDFPQVPSGNPSLREHLLWQLNMATVPARDKQIAAMIIDSLDDDGYLKQDLAEFAALLPPELDIC